MGGKDVIYAKQQHSSKLQPEDLQKRLKEVADKRFVEASVVHNTGSERVQASSKVCEIVIIIFVSHHQNFLVCACHKCFGYLTYRRISTNNLVFRLLSL